MSSAVHNATNPLRRWRLQHRVTQAQLAEAVDVHPTTVSQWEKRRAVPSLETFGKLQRHTGIAMHTLLRFFVPLPTPIQDGGVVVQFANGTKR
jgi:transcriptional regulator with XRE-family HTH domain